MSAELDGDGKAHIHLTSDVPSGITGVDHKRVYVRSCERYCMVLMKCLTRGFWADVSAWLVTCVNCLWAGKWEVEVILWSATEAPPEDCESGIFGLDALGSEVVWQQSVAALLQHHKLERTGA